MKYYVLFYMFTNLYNLTLPNSRIAVSLRHA